MGACDRTIRTVEVVALCLVTALVTSAVAQGVARRQGRMAAELAAKDSVAHRVALAAMDARRTADAELARLRARADTVRRVGRRVEGNRRDVGAALDSARAILADTATELATVRATLRTLADRAEVLTVSVATYQAAVDSVLAAQDSSAAAWMRERGAARDALDAMTASRNAWRDRAQCRVMGLPCLSRVKSFGAGATAALLLVLLL